ncbi:hypothetical protein Suden_0714 [Sulfurimonas denitrificans DSM 1251]|jgi:hypothetical protein|uniref:Uncharacterized protein n=1 Tax=Sulfurimonas denitrificans (strain ATCC 33889 / DSM 1251) TaxID=326298 RepID=Q30SN8_SULDN|nr:hypothetical protein [Sulfurimonas denitrificans]ABB43993.1 hypothetical protein Suden_0714 [Sulfurimonas denitrificans DSM 1251]MDD3443123.1 hypothetical protein [Sulfurimonas denitrificans]
MNWLHFFKKKDELKHTFGRSINANISKDEEKLFNKSYEAFEDKEILLAYEYFLKSLINYSNGVSNENVIIKKEDDSLYFEIYQGGALIRGKATKKSLNAEAILCKKSSAHVALKRLILERNYQFTYTYYFSDDEYIKLKLSLDNTTMSPQKLFFPLREIALNADFDKEYIKSEFLDISIEDVSHVKTLSEEELSLKYNFMHKWIDEINVKILSLPSNDNAGMESFILLYLLFKIDYMLVPKFTIFKKSTKKIQEYFSDENLTVEAKNDELREHILELQEMSFDEFRKNFYNAKYTFNPTDKAPNEEIEIFITESLSKIRWYKNNRYNQIIPTMYKYIAMYLLYNYGLNPLTKELLHTLVEIQNPSFFKALGYTPLYDEESQIFAKRAIVSKVDSIVSTHKNHFKKLEPFGDKLNFSSLNELNNSFYLQLKNLNYEEI